MSRRRQEFSVAVKKAAWERCGGRCEGCGGEFDAANRVEYDHRVEASLGGEATLENCVVLGSKCCHRPKTSARAGALAKTGRLERAAAGITRKKRLIPGSKGSGFRKRLDGTVVRE
ncbi:MAG: HNH endonuclease [Gemmatimonadales bacterium]|nr:HNH endonuclease [Gemmatimonadales bacterium]